MLRRTRRMLPGLDTTERTDWMGFRPSLPDSLPVIGRAGKNQNVHYAFGHGHLGLTQAASTARLIRDLLSGQAPAIDISPFSAQRF
jgi:D-amino-acid dehydrogenase